MTYQRALTTEEICRKLKPIFGKKIDELYFRYSVANSFEEKNELMQLLNGLYQKHLSQLLDKGVLLEPPKQENVSGEYPLANVNYAEKDLFPFALREKDWPRHVCVTGMSGSGKTTFAFNILKNFIKKNKPFLVFDWKKSFRPLMAVDNSLMIFTVGNDAVSNSFKININRPPKGVNPKEWINTLCDLLTESFSVSFGVHKILLETLDEAFEAWGVYEGGKHYPNWQHIKKLLEQKIKESKGRETGWYESAMRVATVLTFGSFGKVVNYDGRKSLSIEDLFNKKAIFELNSLSNIEKKFFCEYILTYIYKQKKVEQTKIDKKFNYAILVDEAHNIFLKKPTNFMSESVTDMIYREMREYGTSLICLDQHVSKLSDTVTGNSACHIAFQQQLPQDINDINSLAQTDNKELFSKLQVGSAIVKLSERHTSPFLIKVPFQNIRENLITDEKIQSRMDCLIEGVNIEKYDPEFKEAMEHPIENIKEEIKVMENPLPKPFKSNYNLPEISSFKTEKPKNKIIKSNLSEVQKTLFDYAKDKIENGMKLNEIEKLLEMGLCENCYDSKDIICVINELLKNELKNKNLEIENKSEIIIVEKPQERTISQPIPKEQKIIYIEEKKKESDILIKGLNEEETSFMNFLVSNPAHETSTVQLYKEVGLSPRKGNVIKNQLLQKSLIKIEEIKYDKGWKKFIRINNSH
jgi:hypothetical protein